MLGAADSGLPQPGRLRDLRWGLQTPAAPDSEMKGVRSGGGREKGGMEEEPVGGKAVQWED